MELDLLTPSVNPNGEELGAGGSSASSLQMKNLVGKSLELAGKCMHVLVAKIAYLGENNSSLFIA